MRVWCYRALSLSLALSLACCRSCAHSLHSTHSAHNPHGPHSPHCPSPHYTVHSPHYTHYVSTRRRGNGLQIVGSSFSCMHTRHLRRHQCLVQSRLEWVCARAVFQGWCVCVRVCVCMFVNVCAFAAVAVMAEPAALFLSVCFLTTCGLLEAVCLRLVYVCAGTVD